jgi:hypothetical protein
MVDHSLTGIVMGPPPMQSQLGDRLHQEVVEWLFSGDRSWKQRDAASKE